jgi:chemotaxis protein CheZ
MNTQAKLGTAMLKSLISLREQKGSVNIEDVGAILEGMAHSLIASPTAADKFLREEIFRMAAYIREAKLEIDGLNADTPGRNSSNLNDATTQLSAVVQSTEQAAGSILDAAEEIQNMVKVNAAGKAKEIDNAAARIIESCHFQDINGQRINKVLKVLTHLENKILRLAELFSAENDVMPAFKFGPDGGASGDEALLAGPQLQDEAPSQEDIDMLFASVKKN